MKELSTVVTTLLFVLAVATIPVLAASSFTSDGLGGYRGYDDSGGTSTITPDGLG